jgi:hypothetical protein
MIRIEYGFVLVVACATMFVGCRSGSTQVKEVDPIITQLNSIGQAYIKATEKLGRPPKNADEIKPALQEVGDPDKILHSVIDGEEFVIVWGVDPRRTPPKDGALPVLAYEKRGVGGKRYVLQMPTRVIAMTDDELNKAYFPGGHKFKS